MHCPPEYSILANDDPRFYEVYVLALLAGKAAYLSWLNSQYTSFLEASKQAVEAETENVAQEAVEENGQEAAEENAEEASEESDRNEEHVEPEVASESGSTDWEMD
ncbi:hypothetical protein AAVH_20538 [Aphelenchoides avenae]|nr:hypothetical protein AAVH_20538 [Aphelenchus avenae]